VKQDDDGKANGLDRQPAAGGASATVVGRTWKFWWQQQVVVRVVSPTIQRRRGFYITS